MFAQRRYPSHLPSRIVLGRKNLVDLWRNLLTVAGDDDGRHRHGDMVEFRATVQTGSGLHGLRAVQVRPPTLRERSRSGRCPCVDRTAVELVSSVPTDGLANPSGPGEVTRWGRT